MPLQRYGVLKGSVGDARREDGSDSPHYQVHVRTDSTSYRIAVNVKSQRATTDDSRVGPRRQLLLPVPNRSGP